MEVLISVLKRGVLQREIIGCERINFYLKTVAAVEENSLVKSRSRF